MQLNYMSNLELRDAFEYHDCHQGEESGCAVCDEVDHRSQQEFISDDLQNEPNLILN